MVIAQNSPTVSVGQESCEANSACCDDSATERAARKLERHGLRHRPEYHIWAQMIQRCHNPKDRGYQTWGGRGIRVCDEWRYSFPNFFRDMGPRPEGKSPGGRALYSIERVDNNGNYCPGNCVWATQIQQVRNRRPYPEHSKRRALSDITLAAKQAGVTRPTIEYRLRQGMTLEEAMAKPRDPRGRPRKAA